MLSLSSRTVRSILTNPPEEDKERMKRIVEKKLREIDEGEGEDKKNSSLRKCHKKEEAGEKIS